MSVFDVVCTTCGERGSSRRMDIKDKRCYYCRNEEPEESNPKKMRRVCSEWVFSGEATDVRGHSCMNSAKVKEDGAWWCGRHTKAAKEKRKQALRKRTDDFLAENRRKVAHATESMRRYCAYPILLDALERIKQGEPCYDGECMHDDPDCAAKQAEEAITAAERERRKV